MKRWTGKGRQRLLVDILFLAPSVLFFLYVVLIPFVQGIPLSFTNWNAVNPEYEFIGLQNYRTILLGREFRTDFINTLLFTAITTLACNVVGLLLAMGVYRSSRFHNILRTVYFMPFVLSLILSAYIWKYLFTDIYSPLFQVISPLATMAGAIPGISAIAVWRDTGYCMIVYIAALQSIPGDYLEAAMIDGAGAVKRFFGIILPLLVPAFSSNVTLLMSWGFKVFDYPMAATRGGPGGASETIAMYAYNNIFTYFKAGLGQASAVVMVVLLSLVTLLVSRVIRSKEVEL